ncbi:MAG TPA: Ig-like domain-containing protein [Gemmatimonadaceae bacterium]|nr:Ig-like domain-containing protein [Gemmatimonadaceae bacterium]HTK51563.1 Ig-like domain-containing protein [Gemmatimonadaceae bacterium]
MRSIILAFAASFGIVAAACSSDATSASSPDTTGSSGNTFNVAVDSANADRTVIAGSSARVSVLVTLAGKPVFGVPVSWKPTAGSGIVSDTLSGSDSSGVATTVWTINDSAKVNTLQAIVGTSTATLLATGVAGPASALVKVTADSIAVVAGANALLTVRVTDRHGNPVAGIPVSWSTTSGSLSVASSTSGSSGAVDVTFTTPPAPGTSLVTASAAGIGSVVFHVTGL